MPPLVVAGKVAGVVPPQILPKMVVNVLSIPLVPECKLCWL